MVAKAGFHALALGAALVAASLAAEAMAQDEPAEQSAEQQPTGSASGTAKSDLDQSAIRGAGVNQAPRPTLTSTSTVTVPKILGSYR